MLKLLCTVALLLVTVKANDEKTIPYAFFGSRTTYKAVTTTKIEIPNGFTPRQIIMMARHGTRNPKSGLSQDLLPKLIKYQTEITKSATLCEKDIEAIKNWKTNLDGTQNRTITQKGLDEMKQLAIRVREAFPNLLKRQYNSNIYEILTMPYPRCKLSAQTFIQNIFNDETITELPICDYTDILLMIDGMMEADTKFKEYQKYFLEQAKKFQEGPDMAGVVQRVAAKLGIDSKELNPEIITTMYEVSAYEYAIDENRIPPWYSVFSLEDLEILEYAWDISWSYVIGYGNPHNKKLACPMAIRLEERLRNKIYGEGPDAVFYFACEKNIITLLFIFGIGKGDAPFTASNYKGMKHLNWRTSFYGPWAANFMAVLFEKAKNDYVSFYFNEKPTTITLKDGSSCTVCPWLDIQETLIAFITDNDCINFVATNTVRNYKDTNLYWYFSTNTTYKLVSAKKIIIPDLKPIQIFTVNSRGTASLTSNFATTVLPLLESLKEKITFNAKMTQLDIEAIKNWPQNIENKLKNTNFIQKGHDEIKKLALRVRKGFPGLFEQSDNYMALTIGEESCRETGIVFLQNVYGNNNITDVPTCNDDDFFLMIENIKKRKHEEDIELESGKFKKSDFMNKVVERVKVKMGADDITIDDVNIMFGACRDERSLDDESIPPWCSVFRQEDLEVLEYFDELHLYYAYGYGKPFNVKLACPMAIRLLQTLEDKINKKEGPDGVFHFAKNTNILSLHVMLGLGKDDCPLTSSNFIEMKNRKWRSSMFSPWAANFMAVLFEGANNEYKVAFYFNENITSITLRDGSSCTECPWLDIQNKLQAYISDNDCVHFIAEN
ncbi:multiple inositol polyphosphate phosphatase 1-like [Adelges cooleyi]|uniref:multiple inositol polyphosphate phosphatase 1-like n=1 Tax=Adelges cooleyi TaxID=133065 RepID=UPI0021808289|nr:multiple inositol polyphosphate phosphatase 1-like [Adelges cooleyi]